MKTQPPNPHSDHASVINQQADRCVKCALCAPVCPTYQLTHNESESPRGRIAIAQALAQDKIPLTDVTRLRLDHCLTCRACEAVCPADVKYGDLFDHTQALMQEKSPRRLAASARYLSKASFNRWLRRGLRVYQTSGLQKVLRRLDFFGNTAWQRADAALPTITKPVVWQAFYPAQGRELAQVALFLGCAGRVFDQEALLATLKVLTHVGYGVHVPPPQQCCGALDLHVGQQPRYQQCVTANENAFAGLPIKAIVAIASGCTAVLREYPAHALTVPVRDINEFLVNEPWNDTAELKPYANKVLLHTPCTLQNVLQQMHAPEQLLLRIPELKLTLLPSTLGCCGAAGNYFLRFPAMAEPLLAKTLQAMAQDENAVVLTSNIGCQLHLQVGLSARNKLQNIMHPLTLLAQQLTLRKNA